MSEKNLSPLQTSDLPDTTIISSFGFATIGAVDGRKTLLNYGFDFDFEAGIRLNEWGADKIDMPTDVTGAIIVNFQRNMTLAEMFRPFNDLHTQAFTKNQIGEFLEHNKHFVRPDGPIFFLLRNNGNFFVAKAILIDGAKVRFKIFRFDDDQIWLGSLKPRLVIPG